MTVHASPSVFVLTACSAILSVSNLVLKFINRYASAHHPWKYTVDSIKITGVYPSFLFTLVILVI